MIFLKRPPVADALLLTLAAHCGLWRRCVFTLPSDYADSLWRS